MLVKNLLTTVLICDLQTSSTVSVFGFILVNGRKVFGDNRSFNNNISNNIAHCSQNMRNVNIFKVI